MFIEFVDPKIIDEISTRDRVKIRIGEPGVSGRFWANLVFYNREDLENFGLRIVKMARSDPPKE